ncbi:MAG TPA: hypothetical protein VMG34_10350 [Bacteroidota bacterium]|nr:hypothetical protein [Bacteroidota bacterium]
MKTLSRKKVRELLTLYLDERLDETSKATFRAYMLSHPDVEAELEALRRQRELLRSKPQVDPNEWFWQRLSVRLGEQERHAQSVFPFSTKYVPVAATLAVAIVGLLGVLAYQRRAGIENYFFEKKDYVNTIYQKGILQGNLLPLFTNLNKDQVLQFALFGTLPVDAEAKTALRVDENKKDGARIELAENETRKHPAVTVEEFCREIEVTPQQRRSVDSILSSARDRIQESVFLGENKSLAVHADLAKYNRMMISHIAANLGQQQRKRFQKFLVASRSPYTFVVSTEAPMMPRAAAPPPERSSIEQFVVITPDSCAITQLRINLRDLQQRVTATSGNFRVIDERAHALMREMASRRVPVHAPNPQLSVFSGSGYLGIRVENGALTHSSDEMPFEVIAREPQAIHFRFESQEVQDMQQMLEGRARPSVPMVPGESPLPPGSAGVEQVPGHRGLDLDSVISAPRDRRTQVRPAQPRRRHPSPFEL